MATRKRTTSITDPATLASSLVDVAGRAGEIAEEEIKKWIDGAKVPEWITSELKDLDAEIKDLSRDSELLTDYGRSELRELKSRRRDLQGERDAVLRPCQENAENLATLAGSMEKAARNLRRAPLDRARLASLQRDIVQLYPRLESADRRIVQDVADYLRTPLSAPPALPAPVETPTAEPATVALPPPTDVEFDPCGDALLQRIVDGRFESYADCLLNRSAQHLSLIGGFEELMCLPLLHGIEHFPFQINTALQVLRRMRGRALLCDEVGLGKTIEAGMILKEYTLRGLARRILILTPPSLVSQWQEQMNDKFAFHHQHAQRGVGQGDPLVVGVTPA
ncbi:MAG: SNF2-related protein, partial [Capsulimonadaceae bacterium]